MPDIVFKVFYGDKAATREQLDLLEDITVEQEQDVAWGASVKIPICTDEKGNWTGADEKFFASFSRVRVEIKVGDNPFTPLIDGPIVGADNTLSGEPGKSFVTLRVQDDSAYLNRKDDIQQFTGMLDHEIAEQLFDQASQIAEKQIDTTPAPPNNAPSVTQRGTEIQVLRSLAERQGMHAYVLPGSRPGQSIGCFKKLPDTVSSLPDLVLLGADRNVSEFNAQQDAQSPTKVTATSINAKDLSVDQQTASPADLDAVGKQPEVDLVKEDDVAVHLAPPKHGDTVDLAQYVKSVAEKHAFGLTATGKLLGECYSGVLSPYQYVTVRGVNSKLSGYYLITKVTHTLSRASYDQSFTMQRKALSAPSSGGGGVGIF
jgi:hypothetical protein